MRNENMLEEENKKFSLYRIIVYFLIGTIFSVLTAMTCDYLGGIRVIVTAGTSIEQMGSLIFFAFMGIVGLYFTIRNFKRLGVPKRLHKVIHILAVVFIVFVSIFYVKLRYFEVSDKIINSSGNVKLVIEDDTISKEGLEMSIVNTLPQKVYYTKRHSLEVYRFGKWYKVSSRRYQTTVAMLWQIPIENQEAVQYNWKSHYGEIGKGRYRVVVKLYQDSACSDEENAFYVASEFIID